MRCLRRVAPVLLTLLVPWMGATAACPSYTVIPDDARARLDERHAGELLYLKQSLYAGRFYDDDRYRLVHPRRFEELTYLRTVEGAPLVPPPADEIIPAGTRVRVERLEWPDGDAVFRRPLYTPRYTTWIFLRVARERGSDVTVERNERHILLLPGGLHDEATFEEWFAASLSDTDPNPWLVSLPDAWQVGIEQKKPALGMTYEALTSALGFPDRIERRPQDADGDGGARRTRETCRYGALQIELVDGVVTSFAEAAPVLDAEHAAATAPTGANAEAR